MSPLAACGAVAQYAMVQPSAAASTAFQTPDRFIVGATYPKDLRVSTNVHDPSVPKLR